MEENKDMEDIVRYHQNKRKKHKIKLIIISSILIAISLVLICIYGIFSRNDIINYEETSDIKYKVNLIENEYYKQNYLDEGIDVISRLIKDINVDFKYNLNLDKERNCQYAYKIVVEMQVKEKTKTNLIYETKEEILNKSKKVQSNRLVVSENIKLDYNDYNNSIKKLVDEYKLSNITSELQLNMYLDVLDKETKKQINTQNLVMSLKVPLTTKTTEITINENVKNVQGQIVIPNNTQDSVKYFLPIGIIIFVLGLITLIIFIKYNLDTRSAEKMYEDELAKILFDYKSYIQKMNNRINLKEYKIIKIDNFKEFIEMKEEIQSPVLMYSEENKKRTTFIMINENVLFANILSAELIREKLIKKSKERKGEKNEKDK